MRGTHWILIFTITTLSACTWVKPTDAGRNVRLAAYDQVGQCKKLGKATVSVLDKVGFISRSENKVDEELQTLARNSAAEMGGDAIVAAGAESKGEQPFDVYRCGR
jgi:hypothetical protein